MLTLLLPLLLDAESRYTPWLRPMVNQASRELEATEQFPSYERARVECEAWYRHIEWMRANPPYPAGGDPRWWTWAIERAEKWKDFWGLVLCARATNQEMPIPKRGEALADLRKLMGDKWGTGWHPPFIGGVVRRAVDTPNGIIFIEE
jgi:hypothetical protein